MQKFYRNVFATGVLALGLAACGDDVVVTEAPPPVDNTPNIISFSVSPSSAVIAPGTFTQAGANLVTKQGVNGTVAWTTSNAAVATVSNTGLITAVAEGAAVIEATATAGGQTAKAQIGVTVRPIQAAQVSIKSVTQGLTTLPVNLGNVNGQIEVTLNFNPGEQTVDSVAVFIGNKRAAKQTFATSPAAGDIVLSINTANYVKNATTGVATVDYLNGPTTISAAVYPRGGAATATNTISIVMNNADGWAADLTKPTRSANNSGNGFTYWGGPGTAGQTTAQLYAVIYTPGRTIASATWGVPGCPNVTTTAAPHRAVYSTAASTGVTSCSTYEWTAGARNNVAVTSALDNTNTSVTNTALIANVVVLGSTPDSLRLDYKAPVVSTPAVAGAEGFNWVNAAWSFGTGATVTDAGVGAVNSTWKAFVSAAYTTQVSTGADLAETNTNTTAVDGYTLRASGEDRLTNSANSAVSAGFGVDKTAPSIRYSDVANFAPIYTSGGSTAVTDSTTRAAFVGLYGADAGAAATGDIVDFLAAAAGTNDQVRTESIDNRSGLSRAIVTSRRFAQGGTTGTTSSLVACATTAGAFGVALVDGWRPAPATHVTCSSADAGYYTTTQQAVDRAGNTSAVYKRTLALDPTAPQVTGVSPNAAYVGNAPAAFTIGGQDDLEVIDSRLRIRYPNVTTGDLVTPSDGLVWGFGAFTPFAARFDNSIVNPLLGTMTVDAFTVSIQEVAIANAAPVYIGTPTATAPAKPDSVAVTLRDVFGSFAANFTPGAQTGVGTEFASPILSATVPATATYSTTYDASANCPAGGVVGGPCVIGGINWRAFGVSGSTYSYRATQSLSVTLPIFSRIDLFGLNANGEWVYLQRIAVPASISTSGTTTVAGGTITGSDNGFERYWTFAFTSVPTGYTAYRALGVNSTGHGLFSNNQ